MQKKGKLKIFFYKHNKIACSLDLNEDTLTINSLPIPNFSPISFKENTH